MPKHNNRLTPKQRRQILERLGQGEIMADLGREFGVTGSAIYDLRRRFRQFGESVIDGRVRQPNPKLEKKHEDYLRRIFSTSPPPDPDPALSHKGNAAKAQAAVLSEFGFKPSREECARVLKKLELPHIHFPSCFAHYEQASGSEFTAWTGSPAAKQLARRELAYLRKHDRIDEPNQPGRLPNADREWRATLRLFHIDDPVLARSRHLALALDKISTAKTRHQPAP